MVGWLLGFAAPAAAQITVPLTIDYVTLREALIRQIYDAPGGRARLWSGDNDCQYLYAENPRFGRAGDAVKLETDGTLSLGVPIGGQCVSPLSWQGIIEIDAAPYLAPNLRLMFRVSDINLYDAQHQKTLIVGRGFDLIKQNFIPRFQTFSFDLGPAVNEFRALAEDAAPAADAQRLRAALATIRGVPPLVPTDDGVRLTLAINAPAMAAAQPTAAPPGPLTPAELAAWNQRLDQWDAFIVFAVKQLGSTVGDKQVRARLLSVLLDGRYRMVRALNQPSAPGAPDPVRVLFLDEWRQLRDIVRSAAISGQLGDHALEFMSFVSAGDALMAFDEAAPALGVRISAADLRRLARIMAPATTVDPLQFNYNEDPELQHIFGIVPPQKTPDSIEPSGLGGPAPATNSPGAMPPPPGSAPPASGASPSSGAPGAPAAPPPHDGPSSAATFIRMTLRLIAPAEAFADAAPPPRRLTRLERMLRRVVVNENNAEPYTRALDALLDAAVDGESAEADAPLPAAYRTLVKATAWQESCWRQFVVTRGRVWFLRSSTGDIGLMQINQHVWRGFYSIPHLEWDIAYNAGAGSQILARLMKRAAARARRGAAAAAVVRSVYAGYNGGPDKLERWRRRDEPAGPRMVDEAFWQKYRALAAGQSIDVLRCAAEWSKAPGH